jgi:hypothetical protein
MEKIKIEHPLGRCPSHKEKLPYLQWHDWAKEQSKKGIKQIQCPVCKLWFFPSEF